MSLAIKTPPPPTPVAIDDANASITAQIEARVPAYFPDLDERGTTIRLSREERRTYSAFYEFTISDGARSHGVIVKVPYLPTRDKPPGQAETTKQRPRLFGLVDPQQMAELEFASLTAIEDQINLQEDPRLGAIRPLELLRGPNAVVMEKNPDPGLRLVHNQARRFGVRSTLPFSAEQALAHAGVWLRVFHQIAPLPHTADRMTSRVDFLAALAAQITNLVDEGENQPFLAGVRSQMEAHALRLFPTRFDLTTSHGDFAPRNLLVGPQNQIAAIDTLARWRAPRLEDVASFLVTIRAPAAQVVTFGLAYKDKILRDYEAQFLASYFDGEPIPLASIRLFEGLLLLDRWSAFAQRAKLAKPQHKLYATWRLSTLRRFLYRYFRHTFRELEQLR